MAFAFSFETFRLHHSPLPRCDRHCVDAIIRATNTPVVGDTFAPISRLLGEVVATRLAQVSVATCDALMSMTRKKSFWHAVCFFVTNVHVLQLLPFICSDALEAAMPLLTSAALRLGQVTRVCFLSLMFA